MNMGRRYGARLVITGLGLGALSACAGTPANPSDVDAGVSEANTAASDDQGTTTSSSASDVPSPPSPPPAPGGQDTDDASSDAPDSATSSASPAASSSSAPASDSRSDTSEVPAPKPGCKRGIAANVAPGPAFAPAVKWWYNWAIDGETPAGIEFVPMIWGASTAGQAIPEGAKFVLGFNEPNFFDQADLSPADAAGLWPEVENSAKSRVSSGVPIVGPGMNFCGPAERCHGTNPYDYLDEFFSDCAGCRVDYVAVHWYNCDLPSLRDYLEPGGGLDGFEQYGVPIWLTEFSCNPSASAEEQEAFMREAIPYLESNPRVFRYSWFSAGPIPNAKLINDDGSPTALGEVYIGLERAECE